MIDRGDCLELRIVGRRSGEMIGNKVAFSFDISDVCRKLCNTGKLVLLSSGQRIRFFRHRRDKALVIGEDYEWPALEELSEVTN